MMRCTPARRAGSLARSLRAAAARGMAVVLAVLATLAAPAGAAAAGPVSSVVHTGHNTVELVSQTASAAPGRTLYVALRQQIAPGWHTYWRNPGDAGQATALAWTLPAGWRAGDIVWPAPERDLQGPIMNYVVTGQVYLPVPIEVPATAKAGAAATLKAQVSWLVCKDVCIPESAALSLALPVAAGTPAPDPQFSAPIRATLAAAPKDAGLTARYDLKGQTLRLAITGAAVRGQDVGRAYFFPYDGEAIDHSKPQLAERGRDGLTLTLQAGYGALHGKLPPVLGGVISLGARAYKVSATAGPPPAGAAGLTPAAAVAEGPGPAAPASASPSGSTHGVMSGSAGGLAGARDLGLLSAIGLAFLGGVVLNLMPCVFPILSVKLAAIARHAEAPERARREGVAFFVGVVASFVALASLLIAARLAGQAVGWGFQLQSPSVIAVLALVMLGAALNLSGVFEFGTSVQGVGSGLADRGGALGAFFTGVLAVVVAAPCTGPFMAGAVGWAVLQPAWEALIVFAALGVGLAAPFTLIAFTPGLSRRLPRPGAWMEGLRKALAFPMYGAAAWLAWVFTTQAGTLALPYLFAAALALAFAAWMFGVGQRATLGGGSVRARTAPLGAVAVALACAIGLVVAAVQLPTAPGGTAQAAPVGGMATQPWSPERVASLQAAGHPVFVDFTAAWCVTCQVNERTTLATREVADAFSHTGAVYLRADWTRPDARISRALTQAGRSGVPLYLVYGKTATPQVLPQLLTPGVVAGALNAAARG